MTAHLTLLEYDVNYKFIEHIHHSGKPSIQWVPGVEQLGREADHPPPTSVEV